MSVLLPPDRRPSIFPADCVLRHNRDLVEILDVRTDEGVRIGAIVMTVEGNKKTGRLEPMSIATFRPVQIETGEL